MQVAEGVDWEVLVVDNGSTDATRAAVEAFILEGHSRFRYCFERGPGKTSALNRGIAEARGEILAFTDDDAVVDLQWLTAILETMNRYAADGVGGKVVPIWDAPRPVWLTDRFLNVLAVLDCGEQVIRLDWKRPPRMLYGVNYAFRRSVFERLGGFNTILGSRGEDQELFDRLAASGACVIYDPAVVVGHRISADRLTKAYYRDWYLATGRARARLDPGQGRSVLGVPLYTIRQGIATLGGLVKAVFPPDRDSILASYLTLNYYAAYYAGRVRVSLSRRQPAEKGPG